MFLPREEGTTERSKLMIDARLCVCDARLSENLRAKKSITGGGMRSRSMTEIA